MFFERSFPIVSPQLSFLNLYGLQAEVPGAIFILLLFLYHGKRWLKLLQVLMEQILPSIWPISYIFGCRLSVELNLLFCLSSFAIMMRFNFIYTFCVEGSTIVAKEYIQQAHAHVDARAISPSINKSINRFNKVAVV